LWVVSALPTGRSGLSSTITAVTRFTLTDIAASVIDAARGSKLRLRAASFSETCAFESAAPEEAESTLISGAKQLQTFNLGI
jgi:hypothetical protein